jgi:hypothetical protein
LNIGLRWNMDTSIPEAQDRRANFNPALPDPKANKPAGRARVTWASEQETPGGAPFSQRLSKGIGPEFRRAGGFYRRPGARQCRTGGLQRTAG